MPCISVEEGLLKGLRKIRNIVVDSKDLRTLVDGGKSPASIVNAYATILQAHAEIGDNPDWCCVSDSEVSSAAPYFSCRSNPSSQSQIHTHSPIHQLVYNLGKSALVHDPSKLVWSLTPVAQRRWLIINKPQVQKALPKIRIPGGRMPAKAS
ncbi:hypothetical protein BDZ94DRAFT_1273196 [Collybia nuda]|uniref:Uncharacterized protein n=1 Tax=Collybia nuda TaxID=64659 RepID=A0A9P5XVD4_9AGAR|nr:hypothetical protein BDZ94DRAFT_1273196 [Collybia nuda]